MNKLEASMAAGDINKHDTVKVQFLNGEIIKGEVLRAFKNRNGIRGAKVKLEKEYGTSNFTTAFAGELQAKVGEILVGVKKGQVWLDVTG